MSSLLGFVYAGIGSRETPPDVLALMRDVAFALASLGATLRSGGAPGADVAFEAGCDAGGGRKEIFVPWASFSGNPAHIVVSSPEAAAIAQQHHPAWARLSRGGQALMARNSCQVLGLDLRSPSHRILCWTRDGGPTGGTGQALRIAASVGIPVRNLFRDDDRRVVTDWLATLG